MKRVAAALLAIWLTGCATLSHPNTFAACKTADIVTTKQALDRGGVEANPIMSGAGFNGFALLSLALIWLMYQLPPPEEREPVANAALAGLSIVTCSAAYNNHTKVMR